MLFWKVIFKISMQTFDKVLKINDQYILALSPFPWVTLG